MTEEELKIIKESKDDIMINAYGYETRIPYKIEDLRTLINIIERQEKIIKQIPEKKETKKTKYKYNYKVSFDKNFIDGSIETNYDNIEDVYKMIKEGNSIISALQNKLVYINSNKVNTIEIKKEEM